MQLNEAFGAWQARIDAGENEMYVVGKIGGSTEAKWSEYKLNLKKRRESEAQAAAQAAAQEAENAQKAKAAEAAQVALTAKNAADQDQASLMLKRKKGGPKRNIMTSPLGLSSTANIVRQTLGGM
jgi:ribosomal protein S11